MPTGPSGPPVLTSAAPASEFGGRDWDLIPAQAPTLTAMARMAQALARGWVGLRRWDMLHSFVGGRRRRHRRQTFPRNDASSLRDVGVAKTVSRLASRFEVVAGSAIVGRQLTLGDDGAIACAEQL